MKEYTESEVELHSEFSSAPDRFTLPNSTPMSIYQEAGWTSELVWTFCKRNNYLVPTGVRTTYHPPCGLVSISTTIFRIFNEI